MVVINGRKAIREALVINSVDFADRPEIYTHSVLNKHLKGMTDCKLLAGGAAAGRALLRGVPHYFSPVSLFSLIPFTLSIYPFPCTRQTWLYKSICRSISVAHETMDLTLKS